MDLSPYAAINPCGYEGLAVTQCRDAGVTDNLEVVGDKLIEKLKQNL
jgi:lipoyl(octanoyl) transferase